MKIKSKLAGSMGMLVLIILVLTYASAQYLIGLKNDTENILKANYNSVNYAQKMLSSLENISAQKNNDSFDYYLKKQQQNITESGEAEATAKLGADFYSLKSSPNIDSIKNLLRRDLSLIVEMNMQAMYKKSKIAEKTANKSLMWLSGIGLITITLAFAILFIFPDYIAKPIQMLNDSIQLIAEKKYSHRIHIKRKDEFGEVAKTFNIMAARLEEYESSNLSKILFEKKRIETIINGIQDPLLVLDENNNVIFINNPALSVLNISEADIKGKAASEVSVHNDLLRNLIKDLLFPLLNEKITTPLEIFTNQKKNYYEKEIIGISYIPVGEELSKPLGSVILLKNITNLKERDFAKTNFIATISHELKTPIAAIKMSVQLLENKTTGDLNGEQQQLINSIKDDTGRLLKITSELLNMSQVETGNIQLNLQPSSPHKIIEQAADATKFLAEQKNIRFLYNIPLELPKVNTDAEKTIWVLTNFLTNAIRYSPEQSVITISATPINKSIRFEVRDEGPGIDPKYHSRLFDRFFQVPGSPRTGTGLGLSISKEFIEAQGGHIGVESEIGHGSMFYFDLT